MFLAATPIGHTLSRRICMLGFVCALVIAEGLVAADWHTEQGFRWAELPAHQPAKSGFTLVPAETTGLHFTNQLDELSGAANRVLYNGSGLALGDFDNDGRPDIFLCSLSGQNALYRNLGNWQFKEVTTEAGLGAAIPQTRGAVFADVNGDGWLDLLITVTGRGALCFLNDRHGKFSPPTPVLTSASIKYGSTSLALADIDGNGTLDLYVVNYRPDDIRDSGSVTVSMINGRPVMRGAERDRFLMVRGRLEECGQVDQLMLNDGAGHFTPVSWTNGAFLDETGRALAEPPNDWGLTARFCDINDDLAPDLYVCNDYWTPDRLWINDGHGHFRAAEKTALRKTSASSMSVDFADIDRDGSVDFFVVDMLSRDPRLRKRQSYAQMLRSTPIGAVDDRPQVMRNTLFLNRHDGTFAEIACYANLPASDWSWAPVFLDVDLDGYEDLLIGAGHFRDVQDYDAEQQVRSRQHSWKGFTDAAQRQKAFTQELMEHFRLYPMLHMPIGAFRNQGNCTFTEVTESWGLNLAGIHQGLALADLDGDGDLDLVVNDLNAPAMVFQNNASAGRVTVRLRARAPNTQGIGAKVTLLQGAVSNQTTEVTCGGHYQSGSDTAAVFATGSATDGMTLEVRWRSGAKSRISGVKANRVYEIEEGSSLPEPLLPPERINPLFEDVSGLISHTHHETEFNDYERQPLLPFKLSQLGPGVAWFDLDGDGHDDLVIGSGRGGAPAAFRSDGQGHFAPLPVQPGVVLPNDLAGLVGVDDGAGGRVILGGTTGYEDKSDCGAMSFRLADKQLTLSGPVAAEIANGSALALGDMNGDGHLALFIAGGVAPGKYPTASPSKLYRFDGHLWKLDAKNSVIFDNIGIVNSAIWSDLNGDGIPELILACEWGPIRVYQNRGGALFEATEAFGLKSYAGWWRGVATGDLSNDGKMDIVASNWGLNSPYRASVQQPLTFFYGQLAQPGVTDVIETEYLGTTLTPRRQFEEMAAALPFLHDGFSTHKAYSEASLEQVLGDRLPLARKVTAVTMTSMAFLNTGTGFRAQELPREAQFAPAFSVNVADLDGDGNEDVFLSQNFFDVQPELARIDAGVGLWLRGDGSGGLAPVPSARSGIRVYGEQRGAALGDYDEDGRVDLVVTQNGAPTKLYHNIGAAPGLRVRLKGPPGNPSGIGAVLRLQFKDRQGPAREIHAGSGYWSQDSLVQVMSTPSTPESLWVRWPGGRVTTTPIPANAREVTVDAEGKAISNR
jgi:enediyne biosynthesis protein E4